MSGENQTVFSALQTAAIWGNFSVKYRDYNSPKGVFVESIAGVENGPRHWQYYLNRVKEIPRAGTAGLKYRLVSGIWRRLPLGVTKKIGPHIRKYMSQ